MHLFYQEKWEVEGLQTVGILLVVCSSLKLMHFLGLIDLSTEGKTNGKPARESCRIRSHNDEMGDGAGGRGGGKHSAGVVCVSAEFLCSCLRSCFSLIRCGSHMLHVCACQRVCVAVWLGCV